MSSLQAVPDPLKLPRTPEEWEEADILLSAVTLSVLQATTAEEKNSCLCTGVYDVLASRFGTRSLPHPQKLMQSRLRQHDRALRKVTLQKNEARRVLRKVKKQGESAPKIQSLAANFLLNLFSRVVMECKVPSDWKAADVKLIPKSYAQEDPSLPGNFRPNALTPAFSKLLSGILKHRWLRHMRANNLLDPNPQKAKLAATIKSAKRNKRSLAIAWLDIANAYGSVHYSLIPFSMAHHHIPPEFCRLLQSWYSGLSATISTDEWSTPPVPLKIGVYQGDPLGVVIFLTVMNTLSDTLSTRNDLGFTLPTSAISINHLLYANDACVISSTPASCQHLLNMVKQWLEWVVSKCRSMAIQASTGKRVSPDVSIGGESIPPVEDDSFKFPGMPVHLNDTAKTSLQQNLQWMLGLIDEAPLTHQQKLRLFKQGVCLRLSWSLLGEDLPITWLERELQPLATKALKRWTGLANTSILFLPAKRGGQALLSLVSLYKRQQATRMVELFTSSDPGVRKPLPGGRERETESEVQASNAS